MALRPNEGHPERGAERVAGPWRRSVGREASHGRRERLFATDEWSGRSERPERRVGLPFSRRPVIKLGEQAGGLAF